MDEKISIRFAKIEDLEAIHALVVQLAIYEKEPDAVTANIRDYEAAFKSDLIGIIVAEHDTQIIGMTLFYDTFSTWKGKMLYLEDFVVNESWRSKGIGERLFTATIEEAKKRNCNMMKWQVLDWNIGAIKFYQRYKAEIEKNWWNGKIIF